MGICGGKLTELLTSIMDLGLKIDYQNRRDLKKLIKKYNKKNYIIYTNLSRLRKTKSLLYSIRNALAHGNFEFKNNFLYGENFYNKNLKGKFVISNKILLNIITIIHNNKSTSSQKYSGKMLESWCSFTIYSGCIASVGIEKPLSVTKNGQMVDATYEFDNKLGIYNEKKYKFQILIKNGNEIAARVLFKDFWHD